MAKSKFSGRYCRNAVEAGSESEGSGISGRVEDSSVPTKKCISLNSSGNDGAFGVPMQVVPMSNLTPFQRKGLVDMLKSELEQIRVFRKRIETQRMSGVTSSSDILSCSNGHHGPQMERKPWSSVPGNELRPLGECQQPRGRNRGSAGKVESATRTSSLSAANALLMKDCASLLKLLLGHQYGWVFKAPVDVVKMNIPDYFSIIKHPMDLGTVKSKITRGVYSGPLEFADDVRLTFSNAMTYNPRGNDFHFMADTLGKYFEVRWKTIEKKLPRRDAAPLPSKPDTCEDVKTTRPMPPSKKRKMTSLPPQPVVMPPAKRVMSYKEKQNLGKELESLVGGIPVHIIDFIKENCPNDGECGEDEIVIDIDDLRDDTLFTLRKLLDDFLQGKQKNETKVEVHEIEVLNDSGPSNSPLLPFKGNDPDDKEVDIGGNDPPVSSYPPLEIEKDTACRINNRLSPESSAAQPLFEQDIKACKEEVGRNCPSAAQPQLEQDIKACKEEIDRLRMMIESMSMPSGSCTSSIKGKSSFNTFGSVSQDTDSSDSSDSESDDDKLNPTNVSEDTENKGSGAQMVENSRAADSSGRHRECLPAERKVSPDKLHQPAILKNQYADTILKAQEKTLNQGEKGDPEKWRQKPSSFSSDCHQDGECHSSERKVSPDKFHRAALLRNRYADTILKAREKTLNQGKKCDSEKLRQHREKLEMEQRKEKTRLQAEAMAAEEAQKRAQAKAAAEARRKRELEREAARLVLLQMEKTVEINENSQFLEDLEMLKAVPAEQLPSSVDETSPDNSQDCMGSFKFGTGNPLEQLGLYIKPDDEEEEGDPLCSKSCH